MLYLTAKWRTVVWVINHMLTLKKFEKAVFPLKFSLKWNLFIVIMQNCFQVINFNRSQTLTTPLILVNWRVMKLHMMFLPCCKSLQTLNLPMKWHDFIPNKVIGPLRIHNSWQVCHHSHFPSNLASRSSWLWPKSTFTKCKKVKSALISCYLEGSCPFILHDFVRPSLLAFSANSSARLKQKKIFLLLILFLNTTPLISILQVGNTIAYGCLRVRENIAL